MGMSNFKEVSDSEDFGIDYAPAVESTSLLNIKEKYGLFINGDFLDTSSSKFFKTLDPSTEKPLAEITEASAADVDKAVKAARNAYEKYWMNMSGAVRARYLFRIARHLQERSREFAVLETLDGGKPIKESRDVDLPLAAAHFFYHAGWADKLEYAFPQRKIEPHGVVGPVSYTHLTLPTTPYV